MKYRISNIRGVRPTIVVFSLKSGLLQPMEDCSIVALLITGKMKMGIRFGVAPSAICMLSCGKDAKKGDIR